jgi:hypothetical protein
MEGLWPSHDKRPSQGRGDPVNPERPREIYTTGAIGGTTTGESVFVETVELLYVEPAFMQHMLPL